MARPNIYRKQYKQQMSRLRRIVREAEKKGIMFPESALPRAVKNPTAKTIERLRSITPTKIRSRGYLTDPITGETLRATPRRQKIFTERFNEAKLAVQSAQTAHDIQDLFNIQYPGDLPDWAYEIWERKALEEAKQVYYSKYGTLDDILKHFNVSTPYELQPAIRDRYYEYYEAEVGATPDLPTPEQDSTPWRDNVNWDTGEVDDKPVDEGEVAYEVFIDRLKSGKNAELSNVLMSILNDEEEYLDLTYGAGEGRRIIIERFKNANEDILELVNKSAFGYQEEAIDNSVAIATIVRGETPSTQDLMDIESAASEIPKNGRRNRRSRFRR